MKLIDINEENINLYKRFEKVYTNSLSQFLSRIYPDKEYIKWCYINVDNNNIGSIWLESKDNNTVKLGVFIADSQYRHKGYGTSAIKKMIEFAKINNYKNILLNVRSGNVEAYQVYKKIGFVETNKFIKNNGISVISMNYEIKKDTKNDKTRNDDYGLQPTCY